MKLSGFLKSGASAIMALSLLAGGCAQTVGDINRVQPGYVKKSAFSSDQKWYMQETVTRVDNNVSGSIFDGYVLNNDKIRWKIDGQLLKAFRTYENIPGETFGGNKDQKIDDIYYGSPVAIYTITSQFDIRRDYNPATGEQSNVIVENMERPEFEREYMRVDFSTNRVPSISSIDSAMQSLSFMPATVQFFPDTAINAANPLRFRIADDMMQIPATYLINPDANYCYTIGYFYDSNNCAPGKIDTMVSFSRIDQDTEYDFVPVYYPDTIPVRDKDSNRVFVNQFGGACDKAGTEIADCQEFRLDMMQRFGFFRTQRIAVDRKADLLESGRIPLANTWPIWEQYYQREAYDEATGLYSGAFITDSKGNRVEIPLEKRKVRKHTYWGNTEWPDYQMEVAQRIMEDWNKLFQDSIRTAYAVEAERSEGDRKAKLTALSKLPSCKAGETTGCLGTVFTFAKNSCNFENVATLLEGKVGDILLQPDTAKDAIKLRDLVNETVGGQGIVQGNLESVCSLMEFYTEKSHSNFLAKKGDKVVTEVADDMRFTWQMVGDMRYPIMNWVSRDQLAGPLGYGPMFADPETGKAVHAGSNVYGHSLETYAFTAQQWLDVYNDPQGATNAALGTDMTKYFDVVQKQSKARRADKGLRPDQRASLDKRFARLGTLDNRQAILKDQGFNHGGDAKLDAIKGSVFEKSFLINDDMLDFWSNGRYSREKSSMGADEIDSLYAKASPSNWASSKSRNGFHEAFRTLGASKNPLTKSDRAHCIYPSAALDDVLIPQATKYKNVKDREKVWQSIAKDINWGVMLHEVGHNMGLRHNYRASSDALNYFDDFWKISDANEDDPRRLEYQYTSIMDYGANFNTDLAGLGKYDRAAIQFAYTGIVQVFDLPQRGTVSYPPLAEADATNCEQVDPARFLSVGQWCGETAVAGDNLPYKDNDGDGWMMSYKKLPTILGGIKNIKDGRKWVKFSDYVENWRALLTNGSLAKSYPDVDGLSKKPADLKFNSDLPMYAVPYAFCSDEFVGNLFGGACNVFDAGSSVEEQIQNTNDMYEFRYIFSAFKRDRFGWNPNGWLNQIAGRYFANYNNAFRYFYFAERFYPDIYKKMDFYSDFAKASLVGLTSITQTLTRPEAGLHCSIPTAALGVTSSVYNQTGGSAYIKASDYGLTDCSGFDLQNAPSKSVNIDLGVGRPAYLSYTQDYYYEIAAIGSQYEKLVALQALADTEGSFIRFDNGAAYRFSNIGYYRLFQEEMLKFMASMMVNEHEVTSGVIDANGNYVIRSLAKEASSVADQAALADPNNLPIDPKIFDIHKNYAMLFGMALMSTTSDWVLDFAKYARISIKGSDDDFEWGNIPNAVLAESPRKTDCLLDDQFSCTFPDFCYDMSQSGASSGPGKCVVETTIELQNPTTGQIYRAASAADLGGSFRPQMSVGWRLLAEVRDLQSTVGTLTRFTTGAAEPFGVPVDQDKMDLIFEPELDLDGDGTPETTNPYYPAWIQDYSWVISNIFGGVPQGYGGANLPELIKAIDAMAVAQRVLAEGGDVSTAPGATELATLFGTTPQNPAYATQITEFAGQLNSFLADNRYKYVEQLEWVDTVRSFYNEFHYNYGL
jgi:hypothetical protein